MLHNDVQPGRRLNDLVHLNDVRVTYNFQNMDFSGHTLYIVDFSDFAFFEYFDCDLLLSEQMNAFLDFAESALAQSSSDAVAANHLQSLSRLDVNGWQDWKQTGPLNLNRSHSKFKFYNK